MSGHMKMHHTDELLEVTVHGNSNKKFIISQKSSKKLLKFLESISYNKKDNKIPADQVFEVIDKKYGKIGAMLKGLRLRDEITQKDLANKLSIKQSHISQIESGKRVVGKNLAQKLAKFFDTDYRLFL